MANSLKKNMIGTIAYTLKVEGVMVDEIPTEEAIEYLHGHENLVPGLEAALEGKTEGDTVSVTVAPADGFGEYSEEEIEEWDADDFEGFDQLEPGMEIEMFDEDGDMFEATILEISGDKIRLDFNPPLAGKTLEYNVQILEVRPATAEEIEMGFPTSLADEVFEALNDEDFDE